MTFQVDRDKIAQATRLILEAIGEDPGREGLVGTPDRVAGFWNEFITYDPGNCQTSFESVTTDQMVRVSGLRVYSLCEHHLLPFVCEIAIAYVARDKVLGLSKFARIAHKHAHRLQLQERLVHDIADEVQELTGSPDVAVIGQGSHSCMVMRGIKTPGVMTTSVVRGVFLTNQASRAELTWGLAGVRLS